jgi:hypothetical protein
MGLVQVPQTIAMIAAQSHLPLVQIGFAEIGCTTLVFPNLKLEIIFINPLKDEGPFLAHFWTLDRPLWMQYLFKKSQIFGEHVV